MRGLLVVGAGGLLLWYLNSKGYLSNLFGGQTPTTPGGFIQGTGTGTGTPPPPPNTNTLAAIFQRLQANAQAPSSGLTAFGWNYSLAIVAPSIVPPDPTPLFAAAGLDASQNMTANQYWSVMAPALTAQFGLSGMRGMGRYYDNRHGGWAV